MFFPFHFPFPALLLTILYSSHLGAVHAESALITDVFISFPAVQIYDLLYIHVRVMFCLFTCLWFSSQQVQGHAYQNRDEFMEHVKMMHRNSVIYNGTAHLHSHD